MKRKILMLFISICMLASFVPAPLALATTSDVAGEEVPASESAVEETAPAAPAERELSTESVIVKGVLPAGAQLVTTPMSDPFASSAPVKKKMLFAPKAHSANDGQGVEDPAGTEVQMDAVAAWAPEQRVYTYDVKLSLDGANIQPSGSVRLSFKDVELFEDGYVEIIHVLDSADAIRSGKGFAVEDPAFVEAFPAEAALAAQVTGEEGAVYVEHFSLDEGTVLIDEDGFAAIDATSFSTYYIVSGNTQNGSTTADVVYIYDNSSNTYYVAPGTTMQLTRRNDAGATSATFTWARYTSNSISGVSATYNNGTNISTSWPWSGSLYPFIAVTVPSTATSGALVIETDRGLWRQGLTATTTIIVMSQEDIINSIMSNSQYPVYLGVMRDASGGIPGEPGLTSASLLYANSSMSSLSGTATAYGSYGSGIIDANINSNPNFGPAVDGTNTAGVADATGVNTKAVLSNIDWDAFLDAVAANGTVKATNGVTITNANKENYEVRPYVVKLQTAYGLGWHINCYVVPTNEVQVSYNANVPAGYTVTNLTVPASSSALPPLSVTAGYLAQNGTNIPVNGTVTATSGASSATLTFLGWNTKSDGSGTTYAPGATTAAFEHNTVLYAMWNSTIPTGTLDISKTVAVASGSVAPSASDTFTFTVTFPASGGARPYTVYNDAGQQQRTGNVSSGGTITLKGGEWARITGVPNGAYTVTESSVPDNYTPSSTGSTGAIRGGATSTAAFTNTYNKPAIGDLTISKSGAQSGDESFIFRVRSTQLIDGSHAPVDMRITIQGNSSTTIKDLPLGTYQVTEDSSWSWRYASVEPKTITLSAGGESVSFANSLTVVSWLSDCYAANNLFN